MPSATGWWPSRPRRPESWPTPSDSRPRPPRRAGPSSRRMRARDGAEELVRPLELEDDRQQRGLSRLQPLRHLSRARVVRRAGRDVHTLKSWTILPAFVTLKTTVPVGRFETFENLKASSSRLAGGDEDRRHCVMPRWAAEGRSRPIATTRRGRPRRPLRTRARLRRVVMRRALLSVRRTPGPGCDSRGRNEGTGAWAVEPPARRSKEVVRA